MNKYFIIATDAESINKIKSVVSEYPALEFIGSSLDYEGIMNTLLKEKPSLLYIDIDNYTNKPFEFINQLGKYMQCIPQLIAMSKNKDQAFDAIKANFADYLLTPLSELEIRKSIIKFQQNSTLKKKKHTLLKIV